MGRKEMEAELRELRKASSANKPISKLRLTDISVEIERLKNRREDTPASRAVRSAPHKMSESAVESVKEAKESEFPVRPSKQAKSEAKNVVSSKGGKATPSKSKVTKESLKKMLEELSDSE